MKPTHSVVRDKHDRPLQSLRLSVTDRCNLRCHYCMPEEDYVWLPKDDLLSFEEIQHIVDAFSLQGVRKVKITGGEPLLRKNLSALIELIRANPRIEDISLTTNGTLLAEHAGPLHHAGLDRITVSLDTLRPDRFASLTQRKQLDETCDGIREARSLGIPVKLNMVVMRDYNDDELSDMLQFAENLGCELRFIEYMDVGGATHWTPKAVVSRKEIMQALSVKSALIPVPTDAHAPARRFQNHAQRPFGIIASTTEPFCEHCDRSRLTADGSWLLCLYSQTGHDLRQQLRRGDGVAALAQFIGKTWQARQEQGAKQRREVQERGPLVQLPQLRENPRLEMHTRGG